MSGEGVVEWDVVGLQGWLLRCVGLCSVVVVGVAVAAVLLLLVAVVLLLSCLL